MDEVRKGDLACHGIAVEKIYREYRLSASNVPWSSAWMEYDWSREGGLWLLKWLWSRQGPNRWYGGELIPRGANWPILGLLMWKDQVWIEKQKGYGTFVRGAFWSKECGE